MTNNRNCPTYECPNCEEEIQLPEDEFGHRTSEFNVLGEPFSCPKCGAIVELEGDYASEDSWFFMLVLVRPKK